MRSLKVMPLIHHYASFQVFSDGEQNNRLVCITDFLLNEFAEEIRTIVDIMAVGT